MNDYTINNCQTNDPEEFKANLYKCLDVLEQHRGEQYAQLVLQMPETMEHNIWNFFIYADTEEGFTTSWQDYYDGEDIEDYTPEHCATREDVFNTLVYNTTTPDPDDDPTVSGTAWFDINLMEVTFE